MTNSSGSGTWRSFLSLSGIRFIPPPAVGSPFYPFLSLPSTKIPLTPAHPPPPLSEIPGERKKERMVS